MPLMLLKAAALAGTLAVGGVGAHSELDGSAQGVKVIYVVRSGDTLGAIAGYFCHDQSKYRELAQANGISDPNRISVGERVWLACGGSGGSTVRATGSSSGAITGSSYQAGSANIPATSRIYSLAGLARLWEAAGGSSGTAWHAACIAMHESTGRPWAISPTNDWGLWQIHNGGYAMLNAYANAQRAIAMSGNGTNWSQWTTRGFC